MNAKILVVIGLFVAAVCGAVALALLEGGIEYRTVPDLQSSIYSGERVKVKAQVLDVHKDFKPALFTIVDIPPEGQTLPADAPRCEVIYDGDDVPQGLKKAAHVTIEGRYDPERRAFIATLIQTQCPSRYEGQALPAIEVAAP